MWYIASCGLWEFVDFDKYTKNQRRKRGQGTRERRKKKSVHNGNVPMASETSLNCMFIQSSFQSGSRYFCCIRADRNCEPRYTQVRLPGCLLLGSTRNK